MATLLLQKGAWAEGYDAADDTPLHLAARHARVCCGLARGASGGAGWGGSTTLVGERWAAAGRQALSYAPPCCAAPFLMRVTGRHGHVGAAEALLRHGAKPGATNKQGLTPLAAALVGGHTATAKLLLE